MSCFLSTLITITAFITKFDKYNKRVNNQIDFKLKVVKFNEKFNKSIKSVIYFILVIQYWFYNQDNQFRNNLTFLLPLRKKYRDFIKTKLEKKNQMISEQQDSKLKRILFECRDLTQIDEFLAENQDLNPSLVLDDNQNNVLHQLAYEDHLDIIKLYVHHTIKLYRRQAQVRKGLDKIYQKDYRQQIIQWFNKKNKQGFTPFLYAAYMGNLETVRYFHQQGANIYAETKTGLNAFHLAAQNDKVNVFLYFMDKISLSSLDNSKSTPLHWAAFSNSEIVTEYILASKQVDLDLKDSEGQTPLHLAASYGNTRIVRRLLLKGANRYLKNNEGKTPQRIAIQNNYKGIKKMLTEKYTLMDFLKLYCNIKIEYRPKSKGFLLPLVFLFSIGIALTSINTILVYTNDYAFSFQLALFLLLLGFYMSLMIPYSKPEKQTYEYLLQAVNTQKICFQCVRKKPRRSNHCQRCGVCIPQFDHHCTWIRNCVGKHNLARFIIFVGLLVIAMAFIGVISMFALIELFVDTEEIYKFWFKFRFEQMGQIERGCAIFLLAMNVLMSLFIFPVIGLFLVQMKNVLTNKTTYEKLKTKVIPEKQLVRTKLKKGREISYWKNCKIMCSANDSFISTEPTLKSDEEIQDNRLNTIKFSENNILDHHEQIEGKIIAERD